MSAPPLTGHLANLACRLPTKSILALVDQATVSGTNFLTTMFVARACTQADLGLYTLGFTLIVLCLSTQDSLIITPFTLLGQRLPDGDRPGYAAAVLIHQALLGLAAALALGAAALATAVAGGPLAAVLAASAVALPAILLREFGRRFAFSRLAPGGACAVDLVTAVVQLSGLAALASTALLTPVSAHLAAGVGCGVAGLGWLLWSRGEFRFTGAPVREAWVNNLALGQWVLATQMTGVIHGYAVHWLLALREGPAESGIFAACLTVVLLTNPLLFGIGNMLAPTAAKAFADEGPVGLRRVVLRAAGQLGLMLALFAALAGLFGEEVLELFYGPRYRGYGPLVFILAVSVLAGALGLPAEYGLRATGHAHRSFKVGVISMLVTVTLSTLLTGPYGLTGAGVGYLAGSVVGAASRAWILWWVLRHPGGRP